MIKKRKVDILFCFKCDVIHLTQNVSALTFCQFNFGQTIHFVMHKSVFGGHDGFLNSLFHWKLLFASNFFSSHDSGLDNKEDTSDIVKHCTNKCQTKRPRQVVMLPIWHKVPSISQGTKNDECHCAKDSSNNEVNSGPSENIDPVVLVNTEQIHRDKDDGNQHRDERQGVKELRGHKKCCKNERNFDLLPLNDSVFISPPKTNKARYYYCTRIDRAVG
jgi:hypothetical protein